MKTNVYEFRVDNHDRVVPQLGTLVAAPINPMNHAHLEIIGDANSSLIAITEVSDFFYWNTTLEIEWNFTSSDHVKPKRLFAILTTS